MALNTMGTEANARRAEGVLLQVLLATREGKSAEVIAFSIGITARHVVRLRARLRRRGKL
jgi:hypothetical protein